MSEVRDLAIRSVDFQLADLATLERVIEDNLAAYYYVGRSLWEIQHRRLYKDAGYGDFDEYCRAKWGMTDRYAYRLTSGYRVSDQLVTKSLPIPPTESHARELAILLDRPDALLEAWNNALELNDGRPTAEDVHAIVEGFLEHDSRDDIDRRLDAVRRALRACNPVELFDGLNADETVEVAKALAEVARMVDLWAVSAKREMGKFLAGEGR